jgi:hypothetical protein
VEFVKDDKGDIGQRRGDNASISCEAVATFFQKHIAVDLGRHYNDRGLAMFHDISCHQANGIMAIKCAQVAIFLVGERFERRGVNDTLMALLRKPDGIFGYQCLSRAGGGSDQNGAALGEMSDCLQLERVKGKWVLRSESLYFCRDFPPGLHVFVHLFFLCLYSASLYSFPGLYFPSGKAPSRAPARGPNRHQPKKSPYKR